MFFDLIQLTWLDAISVPLTFVLIVLIQVINAKLTDINETTTTTKTTNQTDINAKTTSSFVGNGKQQQSEICENSTTNPVTTTTTASTSSSSARDSISSLNNGSIPHPPSPDSLSDEYHEDEDTLSLENLFPCDQSEIYASKKISYIIDELIQTEANYVNNLRKGLANYGKLQEREDLPESLQGIEKQKQLLGNIDEILKLHEEEILPLMLRNQRNLKSLFDEFAVYFDKSQFYCYVTFTINKKISMQVRQEQREWFMQLQTEIKDKLGIDSFLVQPIQRLTRYPLLLQQFISEFYKSGISCKPVLVSVCKLETRLRRQLEVVNQAEELANIEELNELDLLQLGKFRRATEFEAYHHRSRKKYHAKIFLFDRCLLCTEVRKKRISYRQHYEWETLELQLNSSKSVTLLLRTTPNGSIGSAAAKEEYELSIPEAISMTQWLRITRKLMEKARVETENYGKFSLPMDLVLGFLFAVWLIWKYLY